MNKSDEPRIELIKPTESVAPSDPVITSKEVALLLKPFMPEVKRNMLCRPINSPFKISWREIKNLVNLYDVVAKEHGIVEEQQRKHGK